jgi:hypothetical protein
VSVIEGEVRVKQARTDSILHPGDQVTTHASVSRVPIGEEVAWSRNAEQYDELLAELTALGKEIDAQVERPGLRYSTRLLDLAPAGTTVWIALPNLANSLQQTQRILDEKIAESPSLAQWWGETLRSTGNEKKFHDMIEKIGALGRFLGDEVAVATAAGEDDDRAPVLLAEVTNEASFRATLEQEIAGINSREGKPAVRIIEDLATAPEKGEGMLLWIHDGLLIASPSGAELREVAALAAGGGRLVASCAPLSHGLGNRRRPQQDRPVVGQLERSPVRRMRHASRFHDRQMPSAVLARRRIAEQNPGVDQGRHAHFDLL